MSAPDAPSDNSLAVAQFQAQEAERARQQEKADADAAAQKLADLRNTSKNNALTSTQQYFQNLGLDPSGYQSDIDAQINQILSGINPSDPNPGSYFSTAPQDVYGNLTKQYQTKEGSAIDKLFAPNYASSRITSTMDDPVIADLINSQRSSADAIIQNMLKRGVITDTGRQAAEADLDNQLPGIRTKLNTIGDQVISGGQQKLNDIINQGRTTAGTLKLGQSFDPTTYSTNVDQAFNDFVASLGDQIKSNVSGNLFQTGGLSSVAGAAQGAGNTAYNPKAAAGVIDDNTDDNTNTNTQKESIF
jgi:hypothetical protein